jgi:hypothetical protein
MSVYRRLQFTGLPTFPVPDVNQSSTVYQIPYADTHSPYPEAFTVSCKHQPYPEVFKQVQFGNSVFCFLVAAR